MNIRKLATGVLCWALVIGGGQASATAPVKASSGVTAIADVLKHQNDDSCHSGFHMYFKAEEELSNALDDFIRKNTH